MSGSRAIRIVKPPAAGASISTATASAPASPTKRPAELAAASTTAAGAVGAAQKLCKNIAIYGHCKFQDKGCAFSHDPNNKSHLLDIPTPVSSRPATPTLSAAGSSSATLGAAAANASVFIPKASSNVFTPATSEVFVPKAAAGNSGAATDEPPQPAEYVQDEFDELNPYATPASQHASLPATDHFEYSDQGVDAHTYDYAYSDGQGQVDLSQNPYYDIDSNYTQAGTAQHLQPLQYHLYQPPLPHASPAANPHLLVAQTFFMSPTLREDLQRRMEATAQLPTHKIAADGELGDYWGLLPLDKRMPDQLPQQGLRLDQHGRAIPGSGGSGVFGYRSWVYKATNAEDAKVYAIRRIEAFRLMSEAAIATVEGWTRLKHPSLVGIREAFTTRAFGDHSMVFVYDYHPLASNLLEAHLTQPARGVPPQGLIPERILWSYLVQLASAMKAVHTAGKAIRCLDPSKILITGQNRLRINCCGVMDVIAYDGGKNLAAFQQEDLLSLGKLIVSLATLSLSAIHNLNQALDVISRTYSQELHNAILYLLSKPNPMRKSIDEFLGIIRERLVEELSGTLTQNDLLESELSKELENGRLVRLLSKFGFINERSTYDHDPRWAETGDRYIVKLFRDYVFHQIDEHGRPVIDLSHVLTCLNKLDVGVEEQIALVSRDEQSCLIVSYREIKNCVENSFRELAR